MDSPPSAMNCSAEAVGKLFDVHPRDLYITSFLCGCMASFSSWLLVVKSIVRRSATVKSTTFQKNIEVGERAQMFFLVPVSG